MIIDAGTPRSISGHAVSGAIIGLMVSGVYEYNQYKKGEVSKSQAMCAILQATLEGGIVTASGVAAANALGNSAKKPLQNTLEALSCVMLGAAGVYGIQRLFNTIPQAQQKLTKITRKEVK